jgi:predicted Zn finger-like uncharacterized protein
MILTCPACSTRYMVEPPDLGRSGRRVRCAKCGHSWTQGPAPDLPKAVAVAAESEAEPIPRRAGPRFQAKPARTGAVGWLIFLLVIGGGGFAGYKFRQQIVDHWPPATRLYTELGIPLRPIGEGLEIRNLNLSHVKRDSGMALTVAGEIVNTGNQPKDIPTLRASLLDAQQHELQHWVFASGHDRLLPGEAATFQTEVANPKPDATNISIIFTYESAPAAEPAAEPAAAPAPESAPQAQPQAESKPAPESHESPAAAPAPAPASGH